MPEFWKALSESHKPLHLKRHTIQRSNKRARKIAEFIDQDQTKAGLQPNTFKQTTKPDIGRDTNRPAPHSTCLVITFLITFMMS